MSNFMTIKMPESEKLRFKNWVNSLNAETERYILKNCFISRLSHQQPEMTADDQTIITVEVSFNNIEYKIMDQFVSMLEASAS